MYKIFEKLCKKNGITPYKMCKDTGITTATISNWKAGRYNPKADKLQIIADYFNVSLEYLMTGEEKGGGEVYYINEETREIAQKVLESKELRMLFDAAKDAEPEDIKTTYNMLLALKRKEKGGFL